MRSYIIILFTLLTIYRVQAWETDQYTLPEQAIAETGEEVSRYIYRHLLESVQSAQQHRRTYDATVNQLVTALEKAKKESRLRHLSSRSKSRLSVQIKHLLARLDYYQQHPAHYYQTQSGMASAVHQSIGSVISSHEKKDAILGGVTGLTPYTTGLKAQEPVIFYPNKFDSVYAYAGFHRVLHPSHFVLSSTIKLYGIEVGIDKLGHLFNEGYQYYLRFEAAKNQGDTDSLALEKTIAWGIETEDTYFGSWVSGIYSNADLASNYAGLHFYFNLFAPLTLNGVTYPSILIQNEFGDYQINNAFTNEPETLLKRYISYHMNEAFNPSSLEYLQYIIVEDAIKNRCAAWQKRYPAASFIVEKSENLRRWNGDEYGFFAENTISIYQTCFAVNTPHLPDNSNELLL